MIPAERRGRNTPSPASLACLLVDVGGGCHWRGSEKEILAWGSGNICFRGRQTDSDPDSAVYRLCDFGEVTSLSLFSSQAN